MRVLHIYRTYFPDPPGGLHEAMRQIALATRSYDVEARVFALSPTPEPKQLEHSGIAVTRARSWAAPASCDLGGPDALRQFAAASDWADVIHFHFPWPFADVMDLLVRPAKAKVMTYHSDVVRQRFLGALYRPLMLRTLKQMDRVVATSSPYAKTSPILSQSVPSERLRVIPLGIDESTCGTKAASPLPARLGLDHKKPFFLFVGVLRYYKGLHILVEAAAQVQATIVIAGSGPEEERLRTQATHAGIKNIVFAGQVTEEEKVALLKGCLAFVLPSHLRSEAYGMVLVEASIFSKPMITCEIGTGTSFVNLHQETGLVISPESPQALAQAMNTLLSDDALVRCYGQGARQRYEAICSAPALGKAYADLYREVLEERK